MGVKCVHCGEDCGKNPVMWDGKPFCCHGCKTVYQILNEKKLQKYYDIQPMSGIKVEKEDVGNRHYCFYYTLYELYTVYGLPNYTKPH
jgi:Cu+-exporting ATPase